MVCSWATSGRLPRVDPWNKGVQGQCIYMGCRGPKWLQNQALCIGIRGRLRIVRSDRPLLDPNKSAIASPSSSVAPPADSSSSSKAAPAAVLDLSSTSAAAAKTRPVKKRPKFGAIIELLRFRNKKIKKKKKKMTTT
ncbi:hypothetical protein OROHE_010271 [Orobanche hederae]